jgi:hypothetical protein
MDVESRRDPMLLLKHVYCRAQHRTFPLRPDHILVANANCILCVDRELANAQGKRHSSDYEGQKLRVPNATVGGQRHENNQRGGRDQTNDQCSPFLPYCLADGEAGIVSQGNGSVTERTRYRFGPLLANGHRGAELAVLGGHPRPIGIDRILRHFLNTLEFKFCAVAAGDVCPDGRP